MNGADDGVLGREAAAVDRFDPGGAAVGDLDARHIGIGDDFAAVVADAGDEGIGQPARAAARHAEAAAFEKAEEHVHTDGGGLFIGRHQVLAGHAREMHAHLLVLEQIAEQIVAAHLHDAPQLAALAALIEHGIGGADRRRRRIQRGGDHRQPGRGLQRHLAKGLGIALRELRDLGRRLFAVAIQLERAAILEHRHHRHVREDVVEPIARLELELVVLQQRIALDEDVAHGMLVVAEARQRELARDHAAAEPGVALEHQYLLAGRRQIGGRHQAVVARPHGNDIRGRHACVHFRSCLLRRFPRAYRHGTEL